MPELFEQMVMDSKMDAEIFKQFLTEFGKAKLNQGCRMWYLATANIEYDESVAILGYEWCIYLEEAYGGQLLVKPVSPGADGR